VLGIATNDFFIQASLFLNERLSSLPSLVSFYIS
jgi:hypothetical protein